MLPRMSWKNVQKDQRMNESAMTHLMKNADKVNKNFTWDGIKLLSGIKTLLRKLVQVLKISSLTLLT